MLTALAIYTGIAVLVYVLSIRNERPRTWRRRRALIVLSAVWPFFFFWVKVVETLDGGMPMLPILGPGPWKPNDGFNAPAPWVLEEPPVGDPLLLRLRAAHDRAAQSMSVRRDAEGNYTTNGAVWTDLMEIMHMVPEIERRLAEITEPRPL